MASLVEHLNTIQSRLIYGLPVEKKYPVILVCKKSRLIDMLEHLTTICNATVLGYCIRKNKSIKMKGSSKKFAKLREIKASELNNYPMASIVWDLDSFDPLKPISITNSYRDMHHFMYKYNLQSMKFYSQEKIAIDGKKIIATNFFQKNIEKFETVYQLLEDTKSKEHYAHFVKAGLTGDRGNYRREHEFEQYFHPLVKISDGCVVIDAGISYNIDVTAEFSSKVGDTGKVYAFEPDTSIYNTIAKKLEERKIQNVIVVKNGLWSHQDELLLQCSPKGSSSLFKGKPGKKTFITADNDTTQMCGLIPLDEFCQKNDLTSLDIIKMDIEGAEFYALQGAEKSIRKFVPTLCISLYHKSSDLIDIPLFLHNLDLGYKLYVAAHQWHHNEFILYAISTK